MTALNLTPEQTIRLKKTCENLFKNGTASLRFIRILHNDYQVVCNDDLESPDDFYNMAREENKPMHELLGALGYKLSSFGVFKI